MKVKQVIDFKFNDYCWGWGFELQLRDPYGNEINLKLDEDDVLALEETFKDKANRAREKQLQKAKEHLEEMEQMNLEGDHEA